MSDNHSITNPSLYSSSKDNEEMTVIRNFDEPFMSDSDFSTSYTSKSNVNGIAIGNMPMDIMSCFSEMFKKPNSELKQFFFPNNERKRIDIERENGCFIGGISKGKVTKKDLLLVIKNKRRSVYNYREFKYKEMIQEFDHVHNDANRLSLFYDYLANQKANKTIKTPIDKMVSFRKKTNALWK